MNTPPNTVAVQPIQTQSLVDYTLACEGSVTVDL